MNTKTHIAVLISLLGLSGTNTATAQSTADDGPVSLYTVNGVTTTPDGAQQSAIELATAWSERVEARRGIRFNHVYNPTDGFMKDVIESGNQSGINTPVALAMLAEAIPFSEAFLAKVIDLKVFAITQPKVTERFVNEFASEFQAATARSNASFRGHKVILVPHSQGNFFVNAAYEKLSGPQKACTFVVAVATPDSYVPPAPQGQGIWTTLQNDRVIQLATGARTLAGLSTLPRLVLHDAINEPSLFNTLGHGFIKSYLAPGSKAKSQILKNIDDARAAARPAGSACEKVAMGGSNPPGPEFTFVLRESKADVMAQASCEQDLSHCSPYYLGETTKNAANPASNVLLRTEADSNVAQVDVRLQTAGQVITAKVDTRHEVKSVAVAAPFGEKYYPFGTARSTVLARWTLNATAFDENGHLYPSFTFRFTGTGTSQLVTTPDPQFIPDDSEDVINGIWLCPFPRLQFVNTETHSSFITQVGDVGGTFDVGGSIAVGQYEVQLVAGADQLHLASGQMDSGQYPPRSLTCTQHADYTLAISPPG